MPTTAEEPVCNQDAMLVFDASGSMSGDGWGYGSGSANTVPRILKVRAALAKVLPDITRYRRVGLITFGPNQCNVLSAKLAKRFRDSDQLPLIAGLSPKHYAGVVRIFESASESLGAPRQLRIDIKMFVRQFLFRLQSRINLGFSGDLSQPPRPL